MEQAKSDKPTIIVKQSGISFPAMRAICWSFTIVFVSTALFCSGCGASQSDLDGKNGELEAAPNTLPVSIDISDSAESIDPVDAAEDSEPREIPPSRSPVSRKITAIWDEDYFDEVMGLIERARETIEIVHLEYAWGEAIRAIQEALNDASRRGVRVSVLLDDEPSVSKKSLPHLKRLGFDARLDGSNTKLHTKMIAVDGRWVLFGSTNLSTNSIRNNHETNLLIDDPALANACARYAAALRRDPHSSAVIPNTVVFGATVYFDRAFESELIRLIEAAEQSVDLQMYATKIYENDPQSPSTLAMQSLIDAKKRGLRVRVILEQSGNEWGKMTTDLNRETARFLSRGGIDVRFDSLDVFSHAKLLIVDDEEATVGSMNWGYGGFRKYHEMNAIVTDQETVGDLASYFEALWSRAAR